jgi:hypothetical protein
MSDVDQSRDNWRPSCNSLDRRQERTSLLGRRTVLSAAEMPNHAATTNGPEGLLLSQAASSVRR